VLGVHHLANFNLGLGRIFDVLVNEGFCVSDQLVQLRLAAAIWDLPQARLAEKWPNQNPVTRAIRPDLKPIALVSNNLFWGHGNIAEFIGEWNVCLQIADHVCMSRLGPQR